MLLMLLLMANLDGKTVTMSIEDKRVLSVVSSEQCLTLGTWQESFPLTPLSMTRSWSAFLLQIGFSQSQATTCCGLLLNTLSKLAALFPVREPRLSTEWLIYDPKIEGLVKWQR